MVERRKKKNRRICEDMSHQDGKMKSRTQDSNKQVKQPCSGMQRQDSLKDAMQGHSSQIA